MRPLFVIAWQTVSRMRLRSVLTALSLILGVMALTSVAAASQVMEQTIKRTALLTGGPAVTATIPIVTDIEPVASAQRWADSLRTRYGSGAAVARTVTTSALTLSAGGSARPDLDVQLVDPSLAAIRPFEIVSGTWLGLAPKILAPTVVINTAAASQVRSGAGWTLSWAPGQQATVVIVGVVDDGSLAPTAYLDVNQAGGWVRSALGESQVQLTAHTPGVSETQVRADLLQAHALTGERSQIGEVRRTDTMAQLTGQLLTTTRVFVAVALTALVIAAVGMLNIGLSTLAERSDELSLRRAFGAHRWEVVVLMLLEAQIVALVAGLLGVLAAYVTMPATLHAFGAVTSEPVFPVDAALLGVASGSLAALAGAVTPAVRAMRTPIAAIMRA